MATTTDIASVQPISHTEAMTLAATEFDRVIDLLGSLTPAEWASQTSCDLWDVRAMAGHMLGMAEAQASFRKFAHDARVANKRDDGGWLDALTAYQVAERAGMTTEQLVDRFAYIAPRAVRARKRIPGLVRRGVKLKQEAPFEDERWTLGYLFDVISTRDPWMHRLDISRATGRSMVLTPEHDGRLVADVVAEWARRHGQPFTLTLTGPAGGKWQSATGGAALELDALDFCWTLADRGQGDGLLTTSVPF